MNMLPLIIGLIIRQLMTTAGAVVATQGVATQSDVQIVMGALTTIISVAWSIWQKYHGENKKVDQVLDAFKQGVDGQSVPVVEGVRIPVNKLP